VRGFRLEQAHADQPPTVIDAIDREPVHLELADDRGREVDPSGVQLDEGDRVIPGLAQSREHSLLLGVLLLALEAQLVPAHLERIGPRRSSRRGAVVLAAFGLTAEGYPAGETIDRLVPDDVSVIACSLIGHREQRRLAKASRLPTCDG
jgi:hypothetical protein